METLIINGSREVRLKGGEYCRRKMHTTIASRVVLGQIFLKFYRPDVIFQAYVVEYLCKHT